MANRSVELVRLGFEIFQREGPKAVFAMADPEIEIYAAPGIEPTGTYRGVESGIRWANEWFDAWAEFRMEPTEFIEVADRFVVVPMHQVATGKASGIEVEVDVAYMVEIQDGRVTRFHLYPDIASAVEAVESLMS